MRTLTRSKKLLTFSAKMYVVVWINGMAAFTNVNEAVNYAETYLSETGYKIYKQITADV